MATALLSGERGFAGSGSGSQAAQHPAIMNRRGAGCIEGDFGSRFAGVLIGNTAWYSYRQMHTGDVWSLLNYLIENGISGCELHTFAIEPFAGAPPQSKSSAGLRPGTPEMDALTRWRLSAPMSKFEELRRMYAAQGVNIYAYKLEPIYDSFPDGVFDYVFNAAKALGADQVTMELPGKYTGQVTSTGRHVSRIDNALTGRIGKIAAQHKIMVGWHEHLDASPTLWDVAMSQSAYNGINIDVGHYIAAGNHDVIEFIRNHHERITSIHLKDRCYPDHNNGSNEVWGQGDTPLKGILQLMRDQKYTFPGTIELEYAIPKNSNPVIESGRCLAWAKDVLLSNGPQIAATA